MGRMKLPNSPASHTNLQNNKWQLLRTLPHQPLSFHANNLLCHSHTSPLDSHPKENISATVYNLLTTKSNNITYLTSKDTPYNHESFQNKVEASSPTYLIILPDNHLSSNKPPHLNS